MTEPAEPPAPPRRTWLPMVLWTAGILLALGAIWCAVVLGADRGRFGAACTAIRRCPGAFVGRQFGMDTRSSSGVSSGLIARTVDAEYRDFSRTFAVPPRTYFSECCDCPTQETIWQFEGYFVRLYATSALECDAAMVGVHEGSYEQFRAGELGPEADPSMQFVQIDYQSPKRFLYPNR